MTDLTGDVLTQALIDAASRFWPKVEKTKTCWLWTGALTGHGYGNFVLAPGKNRGAHRVAYMMVAGPIPDGLHLDHLCRIRNCVNPSHLQAVTPAVNLLRGIGPTGTKARQTHCIHGHEFTPENTNIKKNGCRECRACVTRKSSERWKRIKAQGKAAA